MKRMASILVLFLAGLIVRKALARRGGDQDNRKG